MASTSADRRLEGKVALVTGGTNIIGEPIIRLFLKYGAKVAFTDINDEVGKKLCHDLDPTAVIYFHCNVAEESEVESAVDVREIGHHGQCRNGATSSVSFYVSCFSFLFVSKYCLMIPNGTGSIINLGSVASTVAGTTPHSYTCAKHAVLWLTKNTAVELGRHGIRVNCVSPFIVCDPFGMKALVLTSDEDLKKLYNNLKGAVLKAEAALYLAAADSKYVNGHNLVVDGGFSVTNSTLCIFPPQ